MKSFRTVVLVLLVLFSPEALAHALSTAHLRLVDTEAEGLQLEVDLALRDIELALGVDADRDAQVSWGELKASEAALADWVQDGVLLQRSGQQCTLVPQALKVRRYADGSYAHLPIRASCPAASGELELGYALLFDQDPGHRAVIAVDLRGHADSTIVSASSRTARFDEAGGNSIFRTYVVEGVHHILIGYDHLAFLLSLLLPLALLHRRGEAPRVASMASTFRDAGLMVTAFTLAHSVTLSLSALGWVVPASKPVEVLIAASVVVAALNNIWRWVSRQWLLAISFGLIHGFGFAGALGELGLPNDARLLGLLAFNLGVELGQLSVALLVLPLICALSRWASYGKRVMIPVSLAIAALGSWWLVQRLSG